MPPWKNVLKMGKKSDVMVCVTMCDMTTLKKHRFKRGVTGFKTIQAWCHRVTGFKTRFRLFRGVPTAKMAPPGRDKALAEVAEPPILVTLCVWIYHLCQTSDTSERLRHVSDIIVMTHPRALSSTSGLCTFFFERGWGGCTDQKCYL
jgi:hypothetical protein